MRALTQGGSWAHQYAKRTTNNRPPPSQMREWTRSSEPVKNIGAAFRPRHTPVEGSPCASSTAPPPTQTGLCRETACLGAAQHVVCVAAACRPFASRLQGRSPQSTELHRCGRLHAAQQRARLWQQAEAVGTAAAGRRPVCRQDGVQGGSSKEQGRRGCRQGTGRAGRQDWSHTDCWHHGATCGSGPVVWSEHR